MWAPKVCRTPHQVAELGHCGTGTGCQQGSQLNRVVRRLAVEPCSARAREPLREDLPVPDVGWLWDAKAAATKAKLAAIAAKPKKSLGQNFVTDDNILARIVRESGVVSGDYVLEVGPGTGNLTKHLIQAGATVLAIEKDYALADTISGVYAHIPQFRCVQGDVLQVNIPELVQQLRSMPAAEVDADGQPVPSGAGAQRGSFGAATAPAAPRRAKRSANAGPSDTAAAEGVSDAALSGVGSPAPCETSADVRRVKLVANLPYYITTEILKVLFPMGDDISVVAFMLQDEVAQRIVAPKPEGSQYRAITVAAHYYSAPRYKLKIDKRHYFPSPKVDGALVTFDLRPSNARALLSQERSFLSLVRHAFSSKRKMLSKSLQPMWQREEVVSALEAMGVDPQLRPQDFTANQFVEFYTHLAASRAASDGSQGEAHEQFSAEAIQEEMRQMEGDLAPDDSEALEASGW